MNKKARNALKSPVIWMAMTVEGVVSMVMSIAITIIMAVLTVNVLRTVMNALQYHKRKEYKSRI